MYKAGRNEPCPCGSGKKFKNCHMTVEEKGKKSRGVTVFVLLFIVLITLGAVAAYMNGKAEAPAVNAEGKQWCETHQTYH